MLMFGPWLCAQPLQLRVANATTRTDRTRIGAIFTTASNHRPVWLIPLRIPGGRNTQVTRREGLKVRSHDELLHTTTPTVTILDQLGKNIHLSFGYFLQTRLE